MVYITFVSLERSSCKTYREDFLQLLIYLKATILTAIFPLTAQRTHGYHLRSALKSTPRHQLNVKNKRCVMLVTPGHVYCLVPQSGNKELCRMPNTKRELMKELSPDPGVARLEIFGT